MQIQQQLDMALARAGTLEDVRTGMPSDNASGMGESDVQVELLQVELGNAREKVIRLQDVLQTIAGEKHKLEEQLKQLIPTLGSVRDSMHCFADSLSNVPDEPGLQHNSNLMSGEGCDIEE